MYFVTPNSILKLFLFIVLIFNFINCFAQDSVKTLVNFLPKENTYNFKLGTTIIPVKTFQYGTKPNNVFIHLHDDETTAVEAAKTVLKEKGGLLIKIENNNKRLITFILDKNSYRFDPNRIFTKTGILATLKKLNTSFTTLASSHVQKFASFVLHKIPANTTTLIAVHNNDEGRLSIFSYAKGGDYEKDAAKVNVNADHDPDNFFDY